jgi:hypothetical protein
MDMAGKLWRGELPLPRAFWEFAILYGLLANLASTGAMLAAVAAGAPAAVVLLVHFLPAPYWLVSCLGAWRSAAREPSPLAAAARYVLPAWLLLMLVA